MVFSRNYIILCLGLCVASLGYSQAPFNGLIVEEIPIPPAIAASIQSEHNSSAVVMSTPSLAFNSLPRCWRVYACLSEQDWEIQAVFGYSTGPGDDFPLELSTSTGFYQSTFGAPTGLRQDIPGLLAVFPNFAYDSWFTIGTAPQPSNITKVFDIGSGQPMNLQFEDNKTGFLVNDPIGGAIFSNQVPPVAPGMPLATGEVLLGQFTSDGLINGTLNFQMRALNPDGSIFLDATGNVVLINAIGISMDLTPGVLSDECSIQFLNVELLNFDVEAKQNKIDLYWETLSERDNSHFIIERSQDLSNWEKVTQLQGAGTINSRRHYMASDNYPLLGITYYRLTQVDNNGDSEQFDPQAVYYEGRNEVQVYPNPAKETTNISGITDQISSIELLNGSGKLVKSYAPNETSISQLNTSDLNSGVYLIKIIFNNGSTELKKLLIKH